MKYEIIDKKQLKKEKLAKEIARDVNSGLKKIDLEQKERKIDYKFSENNENDFFQRYPAPQPEQVETIKREDSIEEGLSSWMFTVADHYRFEAIELTSRQMKLLAILRDDPIWGDALKAKLRLLKYKNGWLTKQISKENQTQVKAFAPYWNKKKILQAIRSMGMNKNNGNMNLFMDG